MNCTWKQTNGEIWVKATMHPNKSYFFSTLHVLVSGHWLRSAVIQAEGLCCSDGYGVQDVVLSDPGTRKVTAWYLYIPPTTQLLYQGTGKKTRPEEKFAKWSTKPRLLSSKSRVQLPRGQFAFHIFNLVIMIVSIQYAYSNACCVLSLQIVAEFLWL